jgi:hypothetical protein
MLEFDQQNIFVKIPFERKHLLISKQQKDKENTCFVQG